MRLPTSEFIRRFLIHVLPTSRQIALQTPAGQWTASIASATPTSWPITARQAICDANLPRGAIRRGRIEKIRRLIARAPAPDPMAGEDARAEAHAPDLHQTCPKCGGTMRVIETFIRGQTPQSRAPPWQKAA